MLKRIVYSFFFLAGYCIAYPHSIAKAKWEEVSVFYMQCEPLNRIILLVLCGLLRSNELIPPAQPSNRPEWMNEPAKRIHIRFSIHAICKYHNWNLLWYCTCVACGQSFSWRLQIFDKIHDMFISVNWMQSLSWSSSSSIWKWYWIITLA